MLVRSAEAMRDLRSGMLFSIVLRGTGSGTEKRHVGNGIKGKVERERVVYVGG